MKQNKLTKEQIDERKYLLDLNKHYTLDMKIQKSIKTIKEFYEKNNGNVIISFSGGRDSSVLLHLIRSIYPEVRAVFADTGLEFPENREIVFNTKNCDIVKPKKSFKTILEEYGIPIVSKEVSQNVYEILNGERRFEKQKIKWKIINEIHGK